MGSRGSIKLGGGAITLRMRHFAEVYSGNGAAAAIEAGYAKKSAKTAADRLLNDERVCAVIRARESARLNGDVMKREERQKLMSAIVRDETREMKDRLKALEMLCRSEGDFFERSEVSHRLPSVLPEKLDEETLIFIARGGLRAAAGASNPAPSDEDDAD